MNHQDTEGIKGNEGRSTLRPYNPLRVPGVLGDLAVQNVFLSAFSAPSAVQSSLIITLTGFNTE